jgi:hypothetical protein
VIDSDEEGGLDDNVASGVRRPITPMPIQDFGANVVYTEGKSYENSKLSTYLIKVQIRNETYEKRE